MMRPTVSLCMIAKNESTQITRAISSAKQFVSEVVVVDTGSSDNTPAIAEELGAKVISTEWKDDFSLARNVSLDAATGDWVLIMDCDEEIDIETGHVLLESLEDSPYDAYYVVVTNLTHEGIDLRAISVRLFRNRSEYRFQGHIHEQIAPSIIQARGLEALGTIDLRLIHHGYNTEEVDIRSKIRRNISILEMYPPDKRDGFFLFNLGTEYLRLGDTKAALRCYVDALPLTRPSAAFGPILVKRTITTLMGMGRYGAALSQLKYFLSIYREYSDLVYLEAMCWRSIGKYSSALGRVEDFLTMAEPPLWYATEDSFYRKQAALLKTDLAGRARKSRSVSLSVCIIGKNDECLAPECIRSINEVADEVIFVDTGSSDRTVFVAREYGARVITCAGIGDHAKPYEVGLAHATGEWALIMNADEKLADGGTEVVASTLKDTRADKCIVRLRSCLLRRDHTIERVSQPAVRLFRSSGSGFPWGAVEANPDQTVEVSAIVIEQMHYAPSPEGQTANAQVPAEPTGRLAALSEATPQLLLAACSYFRQDFAAAISQLHIQSTIPMPNSAGYLILADSLTRLGRYSEAIEACGSGLARYPAYTDLLYLKGVALDALGYERDAVSCFEQCIDYGDAPWHSYMAYEGAGRGKAMNRLGAILARQGRSAEGLAFLTTAARFQESRHESLRSLLMAYRHSIDKLIQHLSDSELASASSFLILSEEAACLEHYAATIRFFSLATDSLLHTRYSAEWASWSEALSRIGKLLSQEHQAGRAERQ